MVKKDFISALVQEIVDGQAVAEETISKEGLAQMIPEEQAPTEGLETEPLSIPIIEEPVQEETVTETIKVEEPIIQPEVLPPVDPNLPEIPEKFKSFREAFQEYNRIGNSFLNSIVDKMQRRVNLLKVVDDKLTSENESLEVFQDKYVGK